MVRHGVWLVILAACAARSAPRPTPTVSLSGVVTDANGAPLAGAEVVVGPEGPWRAVRNAAIHTADSLDLLLARRVRPGAFVHATTDASGRWRATVPAPEMTRIDIMVTAPGFELVMRGASRRAIGPLVRELALRRAVAFDLAVACAGAPCPDGVSYDVLVGGEGALSFQHDLHLERLPAGRYELDVRAGPRRAGEQRGFAVADTTRGPIGTVRASLRPTGTGRPLRGVLALERDDDRARKLTITAVCGRGAARVRRATVVEQAGPFELADAGAPPCTVAASGVSGGDVELHTDPVSIGSLDELAKLEVRLVRKPDHAARR